VDRILLDSDREFLDQRSAGKREADLRKTGKRSVEVEIGGRAYRIRSDLDEDWLRRVAAAVDDAMRRIREHTDTVDSLEVAVLTALNLSRELLQLRDRVAAVEAGAGVEAQSGDLRELIQLIEAELESSAAPPSRKRAGP
jgi:cell division protein ZapA